MNSNQPVQPSDKLISERASRVAYIALGKLETELAKEGGFSPERVDALGNAVHAAAAAMLPPNPQDPDFG